MVNLEEKIGLPVTLEDSGKLNFGQNVEVEKVSIRKLSDLLIVAKDQNLNFSDEPAYTMYRNVRLSSDSEKILGSGLRFDLTVIPPAKIGDEFIKTSGHYHPKKTGTETGYPELYYVVSGVATYLLQKDEDGSIADAIVCEVHAGEYLIIPPGYGHITINSSKDKLVMANWVSDSFQSNYEEYERMSGGVYYYIEKFGLPNWEKNSKYGEVPRIRELKSNQALSTDNLDKSAYDFIRNLSVLDFLNNPEKHLPELEISKLFTE